MTATSKNTQEKRQGELSTEIAQSVPVVFPHGKFPFITSETEACKTSSPSFSWLYLSIREDSLFLFEEIFLRRCARCLDESECDKVKTGITGREAIASNVLYTMISRKTQFKVSEDDFLWFFNSLFDKKE